MRGVLALEVDGVHKFLPGAVAGDLYILDTGVFGRDVDALLGEFTTDIVLFLALGTNPRFGAELDALFSFVGFIRA